VRPGPQSQSAGQPYQRHHQHPSRRQPGQPWRHWRGQQGGRGRECGGVHDSIHPIPWMCQGYSTLIALAQYAESQVLALQLEANNALTTPATEHGVMTTLPPPGSSPMLLSRLLHGRCSCTRGGGLTRTQGGSGKVCEGTHAPIQATHRLNISTIVTLPSPPPEQLPLP
jgi:hypothetical protein